jgi:hypothetical protein
MPAWRLDDNPVSIRKYDVAGSDSDGTPEFVRHVGLCGEERPGLRCHDELPLVHMRPPLERGERGCPVQTVATAGLTSDEVLQVNVFVDEVSSEYEAAQIRDPRQQYAIIPHERPFPSPDGTVTCRQFSCAGFVIAAYADAGIEFIITELERLPPVPLDTLVRAYPDMADLLRNARFRSRYALNGDGPWPVLLAGYVLNALNRPEPKIRTIPYPPALGDEYFPPRRETQRQST